MEFKSYKEPGMNPQAMEDQSNIHPLLIHHVIQKILESTDPTLLGHNCKLFRLVSKDWCQVATRVYRHRRGLITFKKNFIGRVTELFIRSMRTSPEIPFDKFRFNTDSYDNEHFGDLLHECSGAIANLELFICNPCDLKFPKYYPDLVLGRLQSLTMHVRIDCLADIQPKMPSILVSLLKGAPTLRKLDIKVFGGAPKTLQMISMKQQLVKRFGDALVDNFPPTVKEIKLNITLTDEQLMKLGQRQKDLLSLDVYFQQSVFKPGTLQQFLQSVAPALRVCKVVGKQFLVDIEFPVFPRVEYLVVLGKPSAQLEYRVIFPNLSKLEICLWDENENGATVFPNNCISPTVMEMDFPNPINSSAVILSISSCFQNLRILRHVAVQSFQAMTTIFDKLRGLTELDLFLGTEFHEYDGSGLGVDAVFTGFPADMCEWLLTHKGYSWNNLVNQVEDRACLRNLKNLKSLRLRACHMTAPSSIMMTDVTAHFAFLPMENLERLHLDYFPISETIINRLQSKFRLTRPCS